MAKINGKYEQSWTENLLKRINSEDSIAKRQHLISRYLHQREKQVEKVLANIEDDDIDLSMVVEQLWEDLQLAHKQIVQTMERNDFCTNITTETERRVNGGDCEEIGVAEPVSKTFTRVNEFEVGSSYRR